MFGRIYLVLRRIVSRVPTVDLTIYLPNDHFEYSCPHNNALLALQVAQSNMSSSDCDVIYGVKIFPTYENHRQK